MKGLIALGLGLRGESNDSKLLAQEAKSDLFEDCLLA
jgi:hypothetical protein